MASQQSLDYCYMAVAEAHATLSKAERKRVGCALVTPFGVILGGCNGLAPGSDNQLETKVYMKAANEGAYLDNEYKDNRWPYEDAQGRYGLVSKPEVIHAELNCLLKAAREGVSVVGSTLYTTLSCCKPCSEMVAAAGIKRVVYKELYRDFSGVDNLKSKGIQVDKYEDE